MNWNYQVEEQQFDKVPVGDIRVRVKEAKIENSKSGNEMLHLELDVSGTTAILHHYIVFLPDNPQITNRKLTEFFDSFGINRGDFNLANYKGKVGACRTKEDGEYVRVHFFLAPDKAKSLPQWQEGKAPTLTPANTDELIPF